MDNYKSIDLGAWTKVGEGGNGSTFENPLMPDVILKVNKPKLNSLEFVKHEFDVSKAVESVGLQTPRMHEIVRVGDSLGTLAQRIKNKKSLSRICHDDPSRTEEMARVLCEEGRKLFATPCPVEVFPSRKQQLMGAMEKATFVPRKYRTLLRSFAEDIRENDNCVHGDFQTGNLIVSEGKYYWIDLDRFAHGDPMFDIGHLFLICHYYAPMKRVQEIFHMTQEQFLVFWDAFAKAYTGQEDHGRFDSLAGKFAAIDMVVRTCFEKPGFAEKIFFRIIIKRIIKDHFLK